MHNTITIYGAGYVGLVTAVCLAEIGHKVMVVDNQAGKIASLSQGICPIFEPGLEELLKRHLAEKNLSFTTDLSVGVRHGLFQFITVGTPSAEDGSADLQHVLAVVNGIGEHLADYRIIVNKSTAPIGTAQKIKSALQQKLNSRHLKIAFDVVSNPEFLGQGTAIRDFMKPDRIVIGADSELAVKHMRELYASLDDNSQRFIVMDMQSAEFTKYAANAYLAARISFINEMSQLAELYHADIDMIRRGIGADNRIGAHFLFAGCGFGGSCFPKDVRALKGMAQAVNYESPFLSAIELVNHQQKQVLFKKISHYFNGDLAGKVVALWGLSFKPNTDDMRESSSQVLINALLENGVKVQAYDPAAGKVAQQIYHAAANFKLCATRNDTLDDADVLVVVTEWDEFRHPDFAMIARTLRYPAIFDGRNLYNTEVLAEQGLKHFAIGRGMQPNLQETELNVT